MKSVLVIDDDLATRKIVELFLRGEIEIESASNSKDATELINNDVYSLVLMDISLGKGISGVDLLKNLRTLPPYKNVPVIAVTAHAMVGDKEKFLELQSNYDNENLNNLVKNAGELNRCIEKDGKLMSRKCFEILKACQSTLFLSLSLIRCV